MRRASGVRVSTSAEEFRQLVPADSPPLHTPSASTSHLPLGAARIIVDSAPAHHRAPTLPARLVSSRPRHLHQCPRPDPAMSAAAALYASGVTAFRATSFETAAEIFSEVRALPSPSRRTWLPPSSPPLGSRRRPSCSRPSPPSCTMHVQEPTRSSEGCKTASLTRGRSSGSRRTRTRCAFALPRHATCA